MSENSGCTVIILSKIVLFFPYFQLLAIQGQLFYIPKLIKIQKHENVAT